LLNACNREHPLQRQNIAIYSLTESRRSKCATVTAHVATQQTRAATESRTHHNLRNYKVQSANWL